MANSHILEAGTRDNDYPSYRLISTHFSALHVSDDCPIIYHVLHNQPYCDTIVIAECIVLVLYCEFPFLTLTPTLYCSIISLSGVVIRHLRPHAAVMLDVTELTFSTYRDQSNNVFSTMTY